MVNVHQNPCQVKKKMHKLWNTNNTMTKMISAKYKMYKKTIKKQEKHCAWVWGRASEEQRPVVCAALHSLV